MNKKAHLKLLFGVIAVSLGLGCTARIDRRGKLPEVEHIHMLKPGVQNKEDVLRLLGSPSSKAAFDENAWIYTYRMTETVSFFDPKEKQQTVYLLRFDTQGILQDISKKEGLDRDIAIVTRQTETPNQEQSFLSSIFGNFGRQAKKTKADAPPDKD